MIDPKKYHNAAAATGVVIDSPSFDVAVPFLLIIISIESFASRCYFCVVLRQFFSLFARTYNMVYESANEQYCILHLQYTCVSHPLHFFVLSFRKTVLHP